VERSVLLHFGRHRLDPRRSTGLGVDGDECGGVHARGPPLRAVVKPRAPYAGSAPAELASLVGTEFRNARTGASVQHRYTSGTCDAPVRTRSGVQRNTTRPRTARRSVYARARQERDSGVEDFVASEDQVEG
jgi:hypothetical protein